MKILVLRAMTWPILGTFNVAARVWTLLGSTSSRGARRLADSDTARQARQAAEARLRAIAHTYAESTPLVLRLLVIEDYYARGMVGWNLFTPVRPARRVSCWMRLTAYYSSPLPSAETISRILDAGTQPLFRYPLFTRNTAREDGRCDLTHVSHTLTGGQPDSPVSEPERPANANRFVCEPPAASVGGIRRRYGTVFVLTLPSGGY
ncbi:hypothetical protein [Streptomyces sp. NPDC001020]